MDNVEPTVRSMHPDKTITEFMTRRNIGNRLRVASGSVVELINRHGQHFVYRLIDGIEADPSKGLVGTISPLGKRLIGKRALDVISWNGMSRQMQLLRVE